MAEHIGVTLNNATLFTERRVQIENLIELRNLSLKLLSTTRFQDALRLLVMYTMTIMRARDVHLYLYDKDADHLTFGASMWADGRENLEAYKPTLSGRTWRVAHTGHMLLIPDTTKDKATSDVVDPHLFGAVALVPLKRGDEVFGVLLLTFRDPQFFDDGKVRTLELISSQAAIAIENARLFEEVRTRREQLEVVINASRDGIGLLDAQGRLVLVNQSAERLLDRSLQHFVGRSVLRVLASLRRSEQVRQLSEDFVTGMRRTLKLVEAHPDQPTKHIFAVSTPGGQRDLEARSLPVLDEAGHTIVRLVVLRDVSEEKAEERFREEVTNMLVHDLRAPTGSMITSLHMILDLIDTKEFDELGFVAQIALEGGERLMELINLLLELARADTLDTREVPLNHVLQSAIFTLEASIKDANITVINQVTDAFPSLKVDESKVNRVFVNLLDNALRHTPTGGQVRFNAEVVTEKHGDYAKISVIDTGRGIPPEYRSKIFEKFVQVPKSSLRGQKGTGLGLTFCQKIVEAHGGKIWVDSGPEGGAAFWLTLPLVSRDSQQAEPQTPPQTPPDQATAAD
jgi:PAS domain S-box-containing protein